MTPKRARLSDLELVSRMWRFVRPHRALVWVTIALLPVIAAVELLPPALLKIAIDQHISPRRLEGFADLALLYLFVLVAGHAGRYGQGYIVQLLGQRTVRDIRDALHRHLLSRAISFFQRMPAGKLITRLTSDVEAINDLFAAGLVLAVGDVAQALGIVAVLLWLDPVLAVTTLATVPAALLLAEITRRMLRRAYRAIRTSFASMSGFLQEQVSGLAIVQLYAREAEVKEQFREISNDWRRANLGVVYGEAVLYAVFDLIASLTVALVLWVGASRLGAGAATLGTVVAFTEYIRRAFVPLRELASKFADLQSALASAERVVELLDDQAVDPGHPKVDLPSPHVRGRGAVAFERVSFSYPAGERILREVSLAAAPGQMLAVVGATGAGKSTLFKLLVRLYDPESGCITLDGVNVRELDVGELRRRVVTVPQDVFLFAGTIRDNLAMGLDVKDDVLQDAVQAVGAEIILSRRPEGLGAQVLERGANFSAGERQLLSLARALVRSPEVLLLDEATSSVDPEMEQRIQRGLSVLMRGRTTLAIAHRLSTIRNADRIAVLQRGQIAEIGNHRELIARGGLYARLHRLWTVARA